MADGFLIWNLEFDERASAYHSPPTKNHSPVSRPAVGNPDKMCVLDAVRESLYLAQRRERASA